MPLTLNAVSSTTANLLVLWGRLGHQSVKILIDSSAQGNFIHKSLVAMLNLEEKPNSEWKIVLADGATYIG